MESQKQQKKRPNKYLALMGVGLQMGISIYLAAYVGKKIDAHYQFEKKYATFLLIIIAFIGSIVSLLAQLKRINDKDS